MTYHCLFVGEVSFLKLYRLGVEAALKVLYVLQGMVELSSQALGLGLQVLASLLVALKVGKGVLDLSIQLLNLQSSPLITWQSNRMQVFSAVLTSCRRHNSIRLQGATSPLNIARRTAHPASL